MSDTRSLIFEIKRACEFPIGFAQVREDPLLDVRTLEKLNKQELKIIMIASGGCTAALLATHPAISELTIVDPNIAQLALCQIKLNLLENYVPSERLAFLGHHSMSSKDRTQWTEAVLKQLGYRAHVLGDSRLVGEFGLDFIGRYEHLFIQLQKQLIPVKDELIDLITSSTRQNLCSDHLIDHLKKAFSHVMALEHLVALYGKEATQNPAMPFWEHFFHQTLNLMMSPLVKRNPFVEQLLLGQFYHDPYEWISQPRQEITKKINVLNNTMVQALENSQQQYDVIHLSNVLDWLTKQDAALLLQRVGEKLNSGGVFIIRQLNSTLDIPTLTSKAIQWQEEEGDLLLKQDRSFFYKRILIGKKV